VTRSDLAAAATGLVVWCQQVRVLIRKELRQLLADRALFAYTVFVFTLDIVLAAGASSIELQRAPLAVVQAEHSAAGRDLIGRFRPPHFVLHGDTANARQAQSQLDRGDVRAVLTLPDRFQDDLAWGRQTEVQLLVDTAEANQGFLMASYAARITAEFGAEWAQRTLLREGIDPARLPEVRAEIRHAYNDSLNEVWFNTVSEWLTMLTIAAIMLPAAALVRERERGTIEQLVVSPLKPHELILGKIIPYAVIAFFDVLLVMGSGRVLFGVRIAGSIPLLLALSVLYLVAALGIGLLISVISPTQQTAMTAGILASQLPTLLLSGFLFPIRAMPEVVQWLTNLIPARHFLVIVRGIFLKGNNLSQLWPQALALVAIGVLMLGLASRKFRKKL
jgi:ABC-2 type transport system permease protein